MEWRFCIRPLNSPDSIVLNGFFGGESVLQLCSLILYEQLRLFVEE